jgi:hypothetical protein
VGELQQNQYDDQKLTHRAQIVQLERLLYAELKGLLARWGDWVERHRDHSGLPTSAAFTNIPGGQGGHKILCPEMPQRIWRVHIAITHLEDDMQGALAIWYAWQKAPSGEWLTRERRAQQNGIEFAVLSSRVYRARKYLLQQRKIWVT